MRYTVILILLFSPLFVLSSNFRIQVGGQFPGAEGQTIRLFEYGDLISYREQEIASAAIDEDGNFSMAFSRFEPRYVFLRIDHARMGFFVEPGKEYFLKFDSVAFHQLDDSRNPYLDPWYFSFEIQGSGAELNKQIDAFEDSIGDFLIDNFSRIHVSRNRAILDEFRLHTDSIYEEIENPYFRAYYEYKYAYYYRIANLERFHDQMRRHLLNREVQYHNTQYMNFFNAVFDNYLFAGSRNISIWDLRYTINELNSYHALMDSLGKDTLLRNEVIRELVMLKGLQDMHGNPDYRRSNVENILTWVARNSKFPEHQAIAGNILFTKRHLAEGQPAPQIKLISDRGEEVLFPDHFSGKIVFLGFWASWCESCLLELTALQPIFDKHHDNVVFVNISTDRHKNRYNALVARSGFPWYNFHFRGDFRMLDAYHIRNLPTWVLIDENGNIIDYPARRPGDGLATHLDWLMFQRQRKNQR